MAEKTLDERFDEVVASLHKSPIGGWTFDEHALVTKYLALPREEMQISEEMVTALEQLRLKALIGALL